MSNVHVKHVEDRNGDLVDISYWHHGCAPDEALGWPAPEALDYRVYCESCGDVIEAVPLTDAGHRAELAIGTRVICRGNPLVTGTVVDFRPSGLIRVRLDLSRLVSPYHAEDLTPLTVHQRVS